MHRVRSMGLLVVLAVVAVIMFALALFVRAVREDAQGGERIRHGWIVAGPLLVVIAGIIISMIVRHS